MAFSTVQCGPYIGWTEVDLDGRLAVLKAAQIARAPGQGAITSVAGNGVNVSFDVRAPGAKSIEEEILDLLEAKAQLDETIIYSPREAVFGA